MRNQRISFEEVRRIPMAELASRLGLKLCSQGQSATPCPACGALQRSPRDRRYPLGFRRDGKGWECQHCHKKGDGLDLTSWTLEGGAYREIFNKRDVHSFFAEEGCISSRGNIHSKSILSPKQAPPKRPPLSEVKHVWNTAIPICQDGETQEYLRSRSIPSHLISKLNARVIPQEIEQFGWQQARGLWWRDGWRLILPAYNEKGAIEGLKARWIRLEKEAPVKSVSPRGASISGLIMADELSQQMLELSAIPSSYQEKELNLYIVEGEIDFLSLVARKNKGTHSPAILGIWSGGWTDEFAKRLPIDDRINIYLMTDPDEPGERYAQKIVKSLYLRGFRLDRIKRWKP